VAAALEPFCADARLPSLWRLLKKCGGRGLGLLGFLVELWVSVSEVG